MQEKRLNKYDLIFQIIKKNEKWFNLILIGCSIPLIYFLVYKTGGSKYVYAHVMYIPIIYAGITLGSRWGFIIGLIGGILLGPFMPLDTGANLSQDFSNWFFRLIMFLASGALSGYATDWFRKNLKTISLYNQDTNIPNTNSLFDMKKKTVDTRKYTVMTILVNNHEDIVDLLGTEIYYKVLKFIYSNLRSSLPSDTIIVQSNSNRLWLAKASSSPLGADIDLVLKNLNRTLIINDIHLYIEFSLGVSTVENREKCFHVKAYKQSDVSAKYAQKNNIPYAIFNEMQNDNCHDYELLGTFIKALNENQTFLVYQPKVNLKTKEPISFEALIRWNHPSHGLIMPDNFIPMIEETQLIHSLTDWVLKKAIEKIKEFKEENIDICVSINISAKNLYDPNFFNRVIEIINEADVSPRQIEFEIMESALIANPEESKMLLKQFRDHEFIISLDDFGKGYSSLSYLSQLPIQIVKLDKYFMSKITKDHGVRFTVEAIIKLAHQLGYETVAEGIEDDSSATLLQELGCDYAQGYYFAKPINDNEVINWYKEAVKKN